jgi:hypothetical protein
MSETVSTPVAAPIPTTTTEIKPPVAPTTPPKVEPLKVKVDGKEKEVTLEDLKRNYSLGMAAQKRFEEAAKIRDEASSIKQAFSNKDVTSLLKAGWSEKDIEDHAIKFLTEQAQKKSKTPQQLAQEERDRKLAEYEAKEKSQKQKEIDDARNALESREAELYQKAFLTEVRDADKKTWLDLNDPITLQHIINDITMSMTKYQYDMTVGEAVKRLEERLETRNTPAKKEYLRKLIKQSKIDVDEDDLTAFLEGGTKGLRNRSSDIIKNAQAPFAKPKTPQVQSPSPKNEPTDMKTYYEQLNKEARERRFKGLS